VARLAGDRALAVGSNPTGGSRPRRSKTRSRPAIQETLAIISPPLIFLAAVNGGAAGGGRRRGEAAPTRPNAAEPPFFLFFPRPSPFSGSGPTALGATVTPAAASAREGGGAAAAASPARALA